jgi:hypothetical protein
MHIHRIGDVTVLNDYAPVPGFGGAPRFFYPLTRLCFMPNSPWSSTPVSAPLIKIPSPPWQRCSTQPASGGYGLRIRIATTPAVYGSSFKPRHKPGW